MFEPYFESDRIDEVVVYRLRALDDIREQLEAGYTGNIYDLQDLVFNSDFYVVGRQTAKEELLQNLDIFYVIESIVQYEKENFGEVLTDLSEPEMILNTFYLLVGEACIQELNNKGIIEFDEIENTTEIENLVREIDKMVKVLEGSLDN